MLPAKILEDKDEDAMSSSRMTKNRDESCLVHKMKQRTRELMGRAIKSALVNKKKPMQPTSPKRITSSDSRVTSNSASSHSSAQTSSVPLVSPEVQSVKKCMAATVGYC